MSKTLDDIFNDDDLGLLNTNNKSSIIKTDEDRLIDSFEEINTFFEKNQKEPSSTPMSEYNLLARLKGFRNDENKKRVLKPFDRFNLLGYVKVEKKTLDDVIKEDDLGLLNTDGDISIFEFKHIHKKDKRSETDFVAQRKPMVDEAFKNYESMFQKVHEELRQGKRRLMKFENIEKNLQVGNFYLLDGLLLYLESAEIETEIRNLKSGNRVRTDGRTVTIFENGTKSNMLFRSLGKLIQKNGKLITQTDESIQRELAENVNLVNEDDLTTGWIYIVKSKSTRREISELKDLYKVGFSEVDVKERVKNASKEATFLNAAVEIVATYHCYNLNTQKFESLLHRFFAESCLNIDIYDKDARRISPREWFVVPIKILDEAIELLIKGTIQNYTYHIDIQKILLK